MLFFGGHYPHVGLYARGIQTHTGCISNHCWKPRLGYTEAFLNRLQQLDASQYADKRVIIKGCGEKEIPPYAYLAITEHLMPHVKSLMYGEPCSTVPVYKKK